jgi:hypothetical protein
MENQGAYIREFGCYLFIILKEHKEKMYPETGFQGGAKFVIELPERDVG